MTAGWPQGKGPLGGRCKCGGRIQVHWKGIQPEYSCDKCGMVTDHPGFKPKIDRTQVREIVNACFTGIGKPSVQYRAFILLVDQVCFQNLGGHFPVIRVTEFESWGYTIESGRIRRKAH